MPYPTVKTSPYRTPRCYRRRPRHLWPDAWWKRLCERANYDCRFNGVFGPGRISEECLAMIADFNRELSEVD